MGKKIYKSFEEFWGENEDTPQQVLNAFKMISGEHIMMIAKIWAESGWDARQAEIDYYKMAADTFKAELDQLDK